MFKFEPIQIPFMILNTFLNILISNISKKLVSINLLKEQINVCINYVLLYSCIKYICDSLR